MSQTLHRILAPHFVAGFVMDGGVVTVAAPIIRYMIGWSGGKLQTYCGYKDWKVEMLP